ncbi:PHP domain-containing protein [Geobacter sp. AOG1]|uniref:PHP domain-containing protein n=1 Tax=Geobacter sp. AOG1 TaxID=1566346 RepID=UPI001CC7AB6C|nr:PHP domain-containing protein [Geobacter sp. AOG1]GFE58692.1 phosphatase [Geobacter sp. AOG1]
MKQYVDLHLHSIHSDGVHTPTELVEMAAQKGLKAIAIADHDSVGGVDEAIAAARALDVEVIAAVELSVEHKRFQDIHLLGFCIDHRDPAFRERLEEFRRRRDDRGRAIVTRINNRLARQGRGSISYEDILQKVSGALGRPHIAGALIAKGYARDMQDAFVQYLIPCNVSKQYFPMDEALTEIHRLGGVAVLAHPPTITPDRMRLGELVRELAAMGLDGLEVFSNCCFDDDMIFLESLANDLGLIMTGGSDFHGFEDDVDMGSGRGGLAVAYRLVADLKARRAERQ